MVATLLIALFWGFCCAVIGVAVVSLFGADDTPFRPYFKWVFAWQERGGWRSWITSPIGGCVVCTSGQLGLWTYSLVRPWGFVFNVDWAWGDMPMWTFQCDGVSMFLHLLSGCCAVLFAFTVNRAYKWLERRM